jgi:hypothetical protein
MASKQLEVDFLATCRASALDAGDPVLQICKVLNRLPAAAFEPGHDAELIDQIDALMDDLFKRGRLACPGHRWSSEPVASIRHQLTGLFQSGHVRRDAGGRWMWERYNCYFVIVR